MFWFDLRKKEGPKSGCGTRPPVVWTDCYLVLFLYRNWISSLLASDGSVSALVLGMTLSRLLGEKAESFRTEPFMVLEGLMNYNKFKFMS